MSAELPRPLKIKAFNDYALAKHTITRRDKNYLFDMQWASGSGMVFKNYPRYHELMRIREKKAQPEKSGDELIKDLISKFKNS